MIAVNRGFVSALLGGKAGNNMFQYAFLRSFAESRDLGWRLWERTEPNALHPIFPALPLWSDNSIPRPPVREPLVYLAFASLSETLDFDCLHGVKKL